jgi:O-methyltransferase
VAFNWCRDGRPASGDAAPRGAAGLAGHAWNEHDIQALLARVLHDWDDDHAAQILTALGAADGARLRIFERLLPDDDRPDRAKGSDVAMLLLFGGGRERTAGEYRELLDRAGWQMDQMVTGPGGMSVIEATRPIAPELAAPTSVAPNH